MDEHRQEQLARLIIGQTRRETRYGVDRKERIAAPSGAVIFLSTALAPVALKSLVVETYDGLQCGSINVITRENYEFLRDSFFKYALLLQKEAAHTPGNSIGGGHSQAVRRDGRACGGMS